ncbi:response regulator [Flavobacterium lacisediminis]|uniref:Response regulator n=1 Tax=Flavobacterium lacisediminis TaxID=2989705 RepID=A0ABT3EFU1_9FLAO|nr:response regulator [Flavobacterium lacisediminis]MCW1146984.1 response regulator [Flavobacterium lacisediminis]
MIDDHPSMIEGYKSILSFNDLDYEIQVTPAYNCESAYYLITDIQSKLAYDVVFIDLSLPAFPEQKIHSGHDLATLVRMYMPSSKIVILTSHIESFLLYKIHREIEPEGFLVKSDFTAEELLNAFHQIVIGNKYRSRTVQQNINDLMANDFLLDEHYQQIITLLAQGIKTKNMPEYINITLSAIDKRKAHIKEFFNIEKGSDEDIIKEAKKRGLI